MGDKNNDPVLEDLGDLKLNVPGISDEVNKELIPDPDFQGILKDVNDTGESATFLETPQPTQPSPRALEHPQPQGKIEKSITISQGDEMSMIEVDGKVAATDDTVPGFANVPKALSCMDAPGVSGSAKNANLNGKGVSVSNNLGVSPEAYVGTSSEDSAVPRSANPSTVLQGPKKRSHVISYIDLITLSEMNSIPTHAAPSPNMSFEQLKGGREKDREEIDRLKEGREKDREEIDRLKEGREKDREEIDCLKERREKDREEIDCLKEGREKDREEIDCLKEGREKDREEIDCLKEEIEMKMEEIGQLKKELEEAVEEIDRLKERSKNDREEIGYLKERIKKDRKKIYHLKEEIEMHREEIDCRKKMRKKDKEEIDSLKEKHKIEIDHLKEKNKADIVHLKEKHM